MRAGGGVGGGISVLCPLPGAGECSSSAGAGQWSGAMSRRRRTPLRQSEWVLVAMFVGGLSVQDVAAAAELPVRTVERILRMALWEAGVSTEEAR